MSVAAALTAIALAIGSQAPLGISAPLLARAPKQAAASLPPSPEFAVRTADGTLRVYPKPGTARAGTYRIDDETLRARVDSLGDDLFRLKIESAKREIHEVYFPWQSERAPLDGDRADDIFYYPSRLGLTTKATAADDDFAWKGSDVATYPGGTFAPFTILADADDARIVAAANWPPLAVLPQFAAERMVLRYSRPLKKGARGEWNAVIATFRVDAKTGLVPWQMAARRYRRWLDTHVPTPSYPEWMWRGEGFLNVQLENYIDAPEAEVRKAWSQYRDVYPWVLFWGQMSPYAGNCCELKAGLNERYQSWLPAFFREEVSGKGFHGGMYSAPFAGERDKPLLKLDTKEGVAFLADWLASNRAAGANAYYIDTLGGHPYGEAAPIVALFQSKKIPDAALIEGLVDIYPAPALSSGALTNYAPACGAPWKRPEDWPMAGFARLGRFTLGDRMIYLGGSNTDWIFWGEQRGFTLDNYFVKLCDYAAYCEANGPCEHWTEREAFLMGARFDMLWPENNPVLDRILELRRTVGWWDLRPVYLDTEGLDLSGIARADRIDVRRHRTRDDRDLLTIYNERSAPDRKVRVDGREVALPATPYAIVEVPRGGS